MSLHPFIYFLSTFSFPVYPPTSFSCFPFFPLLFYFFSFLTFLSLLYFLHPSLFFLTPIFSLLSIVSRSFLTSLFHALLLPFSAVILFSSLFSLHHSSAVRLEPSRSSSSRPQPLPPSSRPSTSTQSQPHTDLILHGVSRRG